MGAVTISTPHYKKGRSIRIRIETTIRYGQELNQDSYKKGRSIRIRIETVNQKT